MEIILIILMVMFLISIYSLINERQIEKILTKKLKEDWGKIPQGDYSFEKLESLQAFYKSIKDEQLDVDNITWNDLDMDEIYKLLNNTQSAIGEEYLYALLRKPCFSKEELLERNRLMKFFHENEEERIFLQKQLNRMGKMKSISVYQYLHALDDLKEKSNLPHYFMIFGLLLSVGIIFVNPGLGGILLVLMVINNVYSYYTTKAKITHYINLFSFLIRLLNGSKDILKLDIPQLSKYTETLKKDVELFKPFIKGSSMVAPSKVSGNLFDLFVDYIRILFHIDIIKFNSMLSFLKKHRQTLDRIYINIGFLDSMIATASFREYLNYYCEPTLSKGGKPKLKVLDLYHPLLASPVPNSISADGSVLITGSNASGKSTFIKTLAINAILAQTIYTSLSRDYQGNFFMIYSSMALKDNIFRNESYFVVEIKSLKRILDRINDDIPMLCFIDEVLRGTNTLERIAASSQILSSLAKQNAMVFAATHDIELTHILEKRYANYHFQEKISNHEVLFDYKLYEGRAVSRNAIKLLGMLGYSPEIIQRAQAAVDKFLQDGEWVKE